MLLYFTIVPLPVRVIMAEVLPHCKCAQVDKVGTLSLQRCKCSISFFFVVVLYCFTMSLPRNHPERFFLHSPFVQGEREKVLFYLPLFSVLFIALHNLILYQKEASLCIG